METVIQALEKLGRATYREVAARLDIEPVEALNMLREQRDQGLCDFSDGGWFLGSATDAKRVTFVPPAKPALQGEAPERVDPEVIRNLLAKNGAMDTVSLATAVNRNGRGMTSAMRALERQGVVVKNGQGKGVTWSLAVVTEPVKQEPVPEAPAAPEEAKPVEQIVSEIPSFTEGRLTVQAVPTVRVISREIRRAKSKLANLERLRDAVRVVGRHKHLVQQLVNAEVENGKA
ncbi:hypothetical protein CIW60_03565 [Enterobacter roggenkampii]|uniref:DUF1627 domain-containing protein n=1 Tax=Enterobacter roggenkampii TaxID=1812935 RepID=UPI000BA8837E|nr:DUF1627 domain-containing protein [Enterobacter roggenkampii]PAO13800.1 hypothetical protein CIW60_03565 [Enterobacter roggenkampii]WFC76506.1 DUF1627 domain-containing protein [Enterobacter roggenkampii]HDR2875150.1 DUF1627 domain-containing protein [Enterobacter roggenkampii]